MKHYYITNSNVKKGCVEVTKEYNKGGNINVK